MTSAITSSESRDPLLAFAKVLALLFIAIFGLLTVMMTIAGVAVPFAADQISAEFIKQGSEALSLTDIGILSASLLAIAAAFAGLLYFFRLLIRIIDSVGAGDPFNPENASRLERMAWSLLAAYILVLGAVGGLFMVGSIWLENDDQFEIGFDALDPGGLLTILILFILARIFRHGARMREDLEGTV